MSGVAYCSNVLVAEASPLGRCERSGYLGSGRCSAGVGAAPLGPRAASLTHSSAATNTSVIPVTLLNAGTFAVRGVSDVG